MWTGNLRENEASRSNMRYVLLVLLAACSSPRTATHATAPPPPHAGADAGEDCAARCDEVIQSRHDECGRNGSWPAWCAESNERMRTDCELSCTNP